jgi:diazepam-binding inhibitor (GABA receptor modulating acyl-CoA-binding protein)
MCKPKKITDSPFWYKNTWRRRHISHVTYIGNMSAEFQAAAESVKNFTKKPTNEELLELYGLYKQVTVGDCNTEKPSGWWDPKGAAKWDAWKKREGMSKEDAEKAYIELVAQLKPNYA